MSKLRKLAQKTKQVAQDLGDGVRQAFRGKLPMTQSDQSTQRTQVQGLDGETLSDVELMQHFGFTSNPPAGTDCIIIPLGGATSHGIVVATENGSFRVKNLKSGETAIYSDEGASVTIKKGKIIEANCDDYIVNCKKYTVNAIEASNFNTPLLEASAVVTAQGQINGNGGMAIEGGSGASITGDINQKQGDYTTTGDVKAGAISLTNHDHESGVGKPV